MEKNIREKFYYKTIKNYIKCTLKKRFSTHSNFYRKNFKIKKKNGIERSHWLKYFVRYCKAERRAANFR